jgi:hypothetical protein
MKTNEFIYAEKPIVSHFKEGMILDVHMKEKEALIEKERMKAFRSPEMLAKDEREAKI